MAHICLGVRELAAGPDPTWQKKPSQSWGLGAASSGAPLSPEQLSPGLSSKNSHRRVRLAPQGSGKSPVVPAKEDPASSLSTWPSSAGWAAATPCPTSPGPPCPLAPAHVACTPPPAQLTDSPQLLPSLYPPRGASAVSQHLGRRFFSGKGGNAGAAKQKVPERRGEGVTLYSQVHSPNTHPALRSPPLLAFLQVGSGCAIDVHGLLRLRDGDRLSRGGDAL